MFENITKKITNKIINETRDTVNEGFEKQLPIILGAITAGFVLWSMMEPKKAKTIAQSITIINNYHIYNGGSK
jgi:hypothetical protein